MGTVVPASCQSAAPAGSGERAHIEEVLQGLNRGRSVGQVAVSPDGRRLAWIERAPEGVEILVAPLEDWKRSRRITAAAKPDQFCEESDILWSPDSRELAFFSDCAAPERQADLYLSRLDGDRAVRLTRLNGYEDSPAFSPDGSRIAFLYVEGATRPAGALAAMKPPAGVIGEEGLEVQRVAMAPVPAPGTGAAPAPPVLVTPARLHVYEFDWSPDSKALAYIGADPPGENNWWVARLYTQPLGGAAVAILSPSEGSGPLHGLQIAVPRWSPDGGSIALIGGLMSDQGSTGGDLWLVPSAGGTPRNLTPGRRSTPVWLEWSDNQHLFVTELAEGESRLVRIGIEGGQGRDLGAPVFSIPGSVSDGRLQMSLSATADHSLFVFRASTFDSPMEIYSARPASPARAGLAGLTRISRLNEGVTPAWGRSVSLAWTSDGLRVQGWLLLPRDYDPRRRYPLVVEVHGGPAAAAVAHWGGGGGISPVALSALGYLVLQPNPRGSFGEGEAFTQANRRDFGYGDLRDILAGVDAVEAGYPVDPARVGITGWSYGGFMTMFAVTQTTRFRAAVAGAGLSNWQSYYGENSIDQWMVPYFGASVYEDPEVYQRSSAISFIRKVRTPTLVVVGDRDGECPAPQSYEFWHALRDLHVPTRLVVYPNEGHGFVDPEHRRDVMVRAVEWFEQYLPPSGDRSPGAADAGRSSAGR